MKDFLELIDWIWPKLVKLLLILFLLNNLGIVSFIVHDISSQEPLIENRIEKTEEVRRYILQLGKAAQEKVLAGGVYSPYDYFDDLIRINERQVQLGFGRGRMLLPNEVIIRLQKLSWENLDNHYTQADIEKARQRYKEYIDPGRKPREDARQTIKEMGWSGVIKWLWEFYFFNLPLAFVLYLLWLRKENKECCWRRETAFSFRSPFSFFLSLILYPVVLVYIFRKWLIYTKRRIGAEAEYRRTKKKIFTFLSEDEIFRINSFVRSRLSLLVWRHSLLSQGLILRHSLAKAILATLIMAVVVAFLPRPGKAESFKKISGSSIVDLKKVELRLGQNLARMSIEQAKIKKCQSQNDWGFAWRVAISQFHDFWPIFLARVFHRLESVFSLQEFFRKISHIPITVIQYRVCLLSNSN